jgi:hypothetical protein
MTKEDTWEHPKTKLYRRFRVDAELDTKILNILNSNKYVQIISVCSGHKIPSEPNTMNWKNIPGVSFYYEGKLTNNQTLSILRKIPDTKIFYQSAFHIKGKSKGTSTWWRNVSKVVSNLK